MSDEIPMYPDEIEVIGWANVHGYECGCQFKTAGNLVLRKCERHEKTLPAIGTSMNEWVMEEPRESPDYDRGYRAGVQAAINAAAGREAGQSYDLHARLEALLLSPDELTLLTWMVRRANGEAGGGISGQHAPELDGIRDLLAVAQSLRTKGLVDADLVCWSPTYQGRWLVDG